MSKQSQKLQQELIAKVKLFEEADSIEIGNKIRILKDDVLIFNGEITQDNLHKIKELIVRGFNYTIND